MKTYTINSTADDFIIGEQYVFPFTEFPPEGINLIHSSDGFYVLDKCVDLNVIERVGTVICFSDTEDRLPYMEVDFEDAKRKYII